MPEVDLGFPRSWVAFANPAEATEVFRCDLTWLTSRWTCLFGAGCRGIDADRPDAGCCSLGAHFSDDADLDRVGAAVTRLDPGRWERHDEIGTDWATTDAEGEPKTRVVDGACVFHNSPGFAGGYGCALHALAVAEGIEPLELKPDVCWQLPLRRGFRDLDLDHDDDDTVVTEVEIGEYTRADWGPGGAELDWYCSASTEAHVGMEPVYVAQRAELTALMGLEGYAELERRCVAFEESGSPHPHPASVD